MISAELLLELCFFIWFGLILGSFFNVLIYRLPAGISVITPGSACPSCGHKITALENIPLLSYLFLGGKCSKCKTSISLQYPAIELLTAIIAASYWFFAASPFISQDTSPFTYIYQGSTLIAVLLLVPISVIDIRHMIIPDSLSLGGLTIAILLAFMPGDITPLQMVLGILAGGGTLYVIGIIGSATLKKEETMGGGDIKLMAFFGALLGWQGAAFAIVAGSFAGSIIGILLIGLKITRRDEPIPFGPFLALGILLYALFGDILIPLIFALYQ